jgi:UDP-N-acetyl-2-amino-2-deoxyglucuronate dehydrogenase
VAVCDTDAAALAAGRAGHPAPGFASLTADAGRQQADCVVLATPSGLHPQQVIEAAPPAVT